MAQSMDQVFTVQAKVSGRILRPGRHLATVYICTWILVHLEISAIFDSPFTEYF